MTVEQINDLFANQQDLQPSDDYFIFSPLENFNGFAEINFNVTDNSDGEVASYVIAVNSVNDKPTAADNFVFDFEGNILRIDQGSIGYADVDNDNFASLTLTNINAVTDTGLEFENVIIYDARSIPEETLIEIGTVDITREIKDFDGNAIGPTVTEEVTDATGTSTEVVTVEPFLQDTKGKQLGLEGNIFNELEIVDKEALIDSTISSDDLSKLIFFVPGENLEYGFVDDEGNIRFAQDVDDDGNIRQTNNPVLNKYNSVTIELEFFVTDSAGQTSDVVLKTRLERMQKIHN